MISIAIIEDVDDIRKPLKDFLSAMPDFLCDYAFPLVEDFIASEFDIPPDVIILDIGLPGISGLAAIEKIKGVFPESEILMFTIHDEPEKIFRALQSGASGYLLKNTPLSQIADSIREVFAGGAPMSPVIARKVINFFNTNRKTDNEANKLTEKEKEIVACYVDGLTYKEIAEKLGNSAETIKYHTKNIYRKLHINSKAELIKKSLSSKL
jgi:DNA-binding NarL/FixJ family response regulator